MTKRATNEPARGGLAGARATRRSFLVGAGLVAAAPTMAACGIPGSGPMVQLYGRGGSFGALAGRSKLPSGHSFGTVPVPGWNFGAGQAAYMSAVTGDGTVVIATTPYTDNQLRPTSATMQIAYLQPAQRSFHRVTIPSTTGARVLTAPGSHFGGGDIGDVQVVGSGGSEQVMFCSAVPYHGWDVARFGQLPSLGSLKQTANGGLALRTSQTASALARQTRSAAATEGYRNPYGQQVYNSRGLCEMALLPRSGHVVISQYFGDSQTQQGGLMVVDQAGRIRATWQYPAVRFRGGAIKCLVREVESDPSSQSGDERFVIICDSFDAQNRPVPFPVQEFSYDAAHATIRPTSTAVQATADGSRMETAKYGNDGTLYVARAKPDGLRADRVAVYRKGALASRAPGRSGWAQSSWNVVARPDELVAGTDTTGLVRSMALDPKTGTILTTGISGQLQALRGGAGHARVTATVDLGLNELVNRYTHAIGIRKGCVDLPRRALWVPIPQLASDAADRSYPWSRAPQLDQWLVRIDLSRLVGR